MRRTGKTTRLINKAIEDLFEHKIIYIPSSGILFSSVNQDELVTNCKKYKTFIEPDVEKGNMAQENFKTRLINRLVLEHNGQFEVSKDFIEIKKNE